MTSEYSIEAARAKLGDLVTAAQQGQTVIITRNGKPAAQLTQVQEGPAMQSNVEVVEVEEDDELYCLYTDGSGRGGHRPQRAYLELDMARRQLRCGYEGTNPLTFATMNGTAVRAHIPVLTRQAANQLMRDVRQLAATVCDGTTIRAVDDDGLDEHGHMDDNARQAWESIVQRCDSAQFGAGDLHASI